MNDGVSRCNDGYPTRIVKRGEEGPPGWVDEFPSKDCPNCPQGKPIKSYIPGAPIEPAKAETEPAKVGMTGKTSDHFGEMMAAWAARSWATTSKAAANATRIAEAFSRIAEVERFMAKAAALGRLTARVFKLEQNGTHKAGHRIDTLEEKVATLEGTPPGKAIIDAVAKRLADVRERVGKLELIARRMVRLEQDAERVRQGPLAKRFDEFSAGLTRRLGHLRAEVHPLPDKIEKLKEDLSTVDDTITPLIQRVSVLEARTAATRERLERDERELGHAGSAVAQIVQRVARHERKLDALAVNVFGEPARQPAQVAPPLRERGFAKAARDWSAAEAIDEREEDRSREQVEGGSCFVCGLALGPVLGVEVAGVGWRHVACKDRPTRRLVLVESPFRGGGIRTRYADAAMLDCLARGEAPMFSHLLYTRVLDDDTPTDRHTGMTAGWAWLEAVSLLAVYTDLGISDGMRAGIRRAEVLGVKVEHRSLSSWARNR